ncbi:MAG: recombination protein RecR, partial [Candidatus Zixiibacteriota bacterium]
MFGTAASVERLVNWLSRLPGIGRKSATRIAFYILKLPPEEALELAEIVRDVKEKVSFCSVCNNISESDPCGICTDPERRRDLICVVEEPMDAIAVNKAEGFNGLIHVLGGCLSPLDGIGPDDLKIKELLARLDGVSEVIIATNPNVEGEATATYISKL